MHTSKNHARMQTVLSEWSKFDNLIEDPNMAFSWRADDGPTLNAGLLVL